MRRDYLILAGVLIGIVLGSWLVIAWLDYDKESACVSLGRHNCTPRIYAAPGQP